MKLEALFSSKNKNKCLLQFLFRTLRVKERLLFFTDESMGT